MDIMKNPGLRDGISQDYYDIIVGPTGCDWPLSTVLDLLVDFFLPLTVLAHAQKPMRMRISATVCTYVDVCLRYLTARNRDTV